MEQETQRAEYKESQSQWWAREYMQRSDGKVGETDLAIAFKAGRRAARIGMWQWCALSKPKITTNRRAAVVVMLNRIDFEIHTVLTSEYEEYVHNNACVLWAYADKLVEKSLPKPEFI